MWGCLHGRRALSKVYGTETGYNMHSPLSPNVQATLDLFYKEEIRNGNERLNL